MIFFVFFVFVLFFFSFTTRKKKKKRRNRNKEKGRRKRKRKNETFFSVFTRTGKRQFFLLFLVPFVLFLSFFFCFFLIFFSRLFWLFFFKKEIKIGLTNKTKEKKHTKTSVEMNLLNISIIKILHWILKKKKN